jgi:hypothetical protein
MATSSNPVMPWHPDKVFITCTKCGSSWTCTDGCTLRQDCQDTNEDIVSKRKHVKQYFLSIPLINITHEQTCRPKRKECEHKDAIALTLPEEKLIPLSRVFLTGTIKIRRLKNIDPFSALSNGLFAVDSSDSSAKESGDSYEPIITILKDVYEKDMSRQFYQKELYKKDMSRQYNQKERSPSGAKRLAETPPSPGCSQALDLLKQY